MPRHLTRGGRAHPWIAAGPVLSPEHLRIAFIAFTSIALAAWIGALVPRFGPLILGVFPAVGFAVLCVRRPDLGILFVAVTIPIEQALMLGESVTAPRLIGLIVAGGWVIHRIASRQRLDRPFANPLIVLCVLFLCYAGISTTWAPYFRGTLVRLLTLAQLIALAIIAADLASTWKRLDQLAKALMLGALIAAAMILVQYSSGDVRRAGEDISAGDMNAAARLLVTLLPVAFYLVMTKHRLFWRAAAGAYLIVAPIAIAATFSRSSFLLLPLVLVVQYMIVLRHRVSIVWLFAPLIAVAIGLRFVPVERLERRITTIGPYLQATFLGGESGVQSSRGYHMRIGLAIFRDRPILGGGYHSYGHYFLRYQFGVQGADRLYSSRRSSHGSHWGLLADLGLIGFTIWTAILVFVPLGLWRSYRKLAVLSARGPPLLIAALGLAVVLHIPYGLTAEIHKFKLFWLIIGMAVAAVELSRHGVDQRPDRSNALSVRPAEEAGRA